MHLGNGQVTMMCAIYGGVIASGCVSVAAVLARRGGGTEPAKLAAATGFVFAMQALNLPVLSGVSGHLIGGFLLAYWFGSGWGFLAMSLVLVIQSVLLGDGGWQTLGCNVLNMAAIPCLLVYPIWARWCAETDGAWRLTMIGVASYVSVVLAATACALELSANGVMRPVLLTHGAIGGIEVVVTLAAVVLASRFSLVWAPMSIATAIVAAVLGSSPWPDGLEYSLAQTHWSITKSLDQSVTVLNGTIALVIGSVAAIGLSYLLASVLPKAGEREVM